MDYEKKLQKILPVPPQAVGSNWDEETIRVEAEKWCKPFACTVQSCLSIKIRTEEQKERCKEAPENFKRCINDVSEHIRETMRNKNK